MNTHEFKDNRGDTWLVPLTIEAARDVRQRVGVDLLAAGDESIIERLADDMISLFDALYVICEPQCRQRDVTSAEFGERMVGDPVDAAARALLSAIADFYPSRQRTVLLAAIERVYATKDRRVEKAEQMLTDGRTDRLIEAEIAAIDGEIDKRLAALGG